MTPTTLLSLLLVVAACGAPVGDTGALATSESSTGSSGAGEPTDGGAGEGSTSGGLTGGDSLTGVTSSPDPDPGTSTGADTDADTGAEHTSSGGTSGGLEVTAVDVLFIVDNSGSMAGTQRDLAAGVGALIDPLVAAGVDLRVAVTTTDHGNPRCANTGPENGAVAVESCQARVAAGEYMTQGGDLSSACLDVCPHAAITTLPTATADDPTPTPRPWLEWTAGVANVEVPLGEAVQCVLPQGVVGCGFEQPLEALHSALQRAQDPADPSAGFLRPEAHFIAVIVTDETDCSYNEAAEAIFIDNKTFWTSPDDPVPTSSVCWRAGITCEGDPAGYDDCVATDRDQGGELTGDPAAAVLHPVSRYDDALAAVAAAKLAAGSAGAVQLVVIGGVPVGYPAEPLMFADSPDIDYQETFGIGPGCEGADTTAVPPGRMREVAAAHAALVEPMHSICQPDLSAPLAQIAAAIVAP